MGKREDYGAAQLQAGATMTERYQQELAAKGRAPAGRPPDTVRGTAGWVGARHPARAAPLEGPA